MNFTITTYLVRQETKYRITTLGTGPFTTRRSGPGPQRAQSFLITALKKLVEKAKPAELTWLQAIRGTQLKRVKLDLTLRGNGKKRRISGLYPLILEPRWASKDQRFVIAYHPFDQTNWFEVRGNEPLEQQATLFFQNHWAKEEDTELEEFQSNKKDLLKLISFSTITKNLLDQSKNHKKKIWDDLNSNTTEGEESISTDGESSKLTLLGTNLTTQALQGNFSGGHPRSPYRERMQQLLNGKNKRSVLLVGPSGCGKTTIIHRWLLDLIAADDYPSHQNADRIHQVWSLPGKRLIAGMSYIGEWEQQCMKILEEIRSTKKILLYAEDVAHFGKIGRSRESDRCLADLLQGPMRRGELTLLGECTPEQLQALEEDAPGLVSAFHIIHVMPASEDETFWILLHEIRRMENCPPGTRKVFHPFTLKTVLEICRLLYPNRVLPGQAVEVLKQATTLEGDEEEEIGPDEIRRLLVERTGLPNDLVWSEEPLSLENLREKFSSQVLGQPTAIDTACDLILRIKTGLVDPNRPYGVYLFTGPTGTGKTELAKSIAEYLYSSPKRLVRFDMSEFNGYDGPARLIGDRWQPEGLLIQRIREQPFCVLLLDEIEKAHPSILNLLLQLFDEGRLTSASGTTASFAHTVIIMTSNLGARRTTPAGFGDPSDRISHEIASAVREFFPPELFNRIDRIVPFSPLSKEISINVAAKEMNRLFNRRGLSERNIFVYATNAVAEWIAREAFAQQDGARSLKRAIEQRIGDILADHIAKNTQVAMQIVRIFETSGSLQITIEPLQEAQPIEMHWPLIPLLNAPISKLRKHLFSALQFLKDLEGRDELQILSEQIQQYLQEYNEGQTEHNESLYNLDSIRQELQNSQAEIESLLQLQENEHDLLEIHQFQYQEITDDSTLHSFVRRSRLFDRRDALKIPKRLTQQDALKYLAETWFLRRILAKVHDTSRHSVFIELRQANRDITSSQHGKESSLFLSQLAQAYTTARGEVESVTLRLNRGDKIELRGSDLCKRMEQWLKQGVEQIIIKVLGLCVLDFFEHETGSHVWQSIASQPEIIQVRVRPASPGVSAHMLLDEYDQARALFEAGLQQGITRPNPDQLLPTVRKIRFDPPKHPGTNALLELEDYILNHGANPWVRSIREALPILWLLRMSGQPYEEPTAIISS